MRHFCDRARSLDPAGGIPAEMAAHLEACAPCREQLEVDAALRRHFGSVGGGEVPFGFETRTVRRLREAEPRLRHRQRLLLQVYWLVSCLVSGFVVAPLDVPDLDSRALVALVAAVGAALLPALPLIPVALGRSRAGP